MEIVLIRHGLPLREERDDASMADPPLAEIGIQQAQRMADWLIADEKPVTHVVISPRLRAVQTAANLCEQLGLEPEIIEEFAEIDRSASVYIPMEEMRREKHPQLKKLMNQEWEAAGFMDPAKFQKEVLKKFWKLVERQDADDKIAIVCHGGTINAIVSGILKLEEFFFFEPGYTSITRLKTDLRGRDVDKKGRKNFRIFTLNEMAHMHAKPKHLKELPKI